MNEFYLALERYRELGRDENFSLLSFVAVTMRLIFLEIYKGGLLLLRTENMTLTTNVTHYGPLSVGRLKTP